MIFTMRMLTTFTNSESPKPAALFSILLTAVFFITAVLNPALGSTDGDSKEKWSTDDIIKQESMRDAAFSPDGNRLAWVKYRPSEEKNKKVGDLYLTYLNQKGEDGKPLTIQLTRTEDTDRDPVFSADGNTIYFLSSREKGKAIWAIDSRGGSPYELHKLEVTISALKRFGEGKVTFVSEEGETLYEKEREEKKDDVLIVEDTAHFKPKRVFALDTEDKEIKRLTDNRYPVSEYAISGDRKWLVSSHIRSPHYPADGKPKPSYYLWNLESGEKTRILQEGYQTPGSFTFTQDSKGFYFRSVKSSDPEWNGAGISLLHYFDLSEKQPRQVDLKWDWGLSGSFELAGDHVLATLANGPTRKLAFYERDGNEWEKKEVEAAGMNEYLDVDIVSKDGQKVFAVHSKASQPPKYLLLELDENRRDLELENRKEIIELNSHFEKKKIARAEIMRWTGAMGDEVNGILYYPQDYNPERTYPLIVAIHGGPSGVDLDRWSESWAYYPNLMAQKGAFVLMPNYHGSSNHGLEFVESIKGHYYEYETIDIKTGVDTLVAGGKVTADSLAIMGWSNGAILTTKMTLEYPDMFKVAAPGAGDVNWTSDYGTCRFGVTFDQSYFGGAPWDDTDGKFYNPTYIHKSPLFELEKVTTPTIIFHGSKDRAVPRDQGWEYYRALQQSGKAPVRFLWFPGERHSLRKLSYQRKKVNEEIAWFGRYLWENYKPENEAFKEESPLAGLLKQANAAMSDGFYGVKNENGTLLPEMVSLGKDSISIARFEVTHAQFAEFDADFSYPAARANYPVTGLSSEQINAYLAWLEEQTGKAFRLPNTSEAQAWHQSARKNAGEENTLNYWAGYDLTFDEVAELRKKLDEVEMNRLLKEVGSFKPAMMNGEPVYDLGGNAAEYYRNEAGELAHYGFSAVDFADEKAEADLQKTITENGLTGFRLIVQ